MSEQALLRIAKRILSTKEKRRIRLLCGDGLSRVSEVLKPYWKRREVTRLQTLRCTPNPAYFILWDLVDRGLIDVIVTTNYDCYLDSIFADRATFNPVLSPDCLKYADYCCSSAERKRLRIWKIHGTLNCAYESHSGHVVGLPRIPVQPVVKGEHWAYGALSAYRSGRLRRYRHLIDINRKNTSRDCFKLLIDSAKEALTDRTETAAIMVLGFKGFYDFSNPKSKYNEELTPHLIEAARHIPTFCYLEHEQLRTGRYTLWEHLQSTNPSHCIESVQPALFGFWQSLLGEGKDFNSSYEKWKKELKFMEYDVLGKLLNAAGFK